MCAGINDAQRFQQRTAMSEHSGYSPGTAPILTFLIERCSLCASDITNDRMAERVTTLCTPRVTYGIYRGLPFVYPIVVNYSPGEAEQQCAELHNNQHTFGRREASMRLIVLLISRLEPRASSSRTPGRCTHSTVRPGAVWLPGYTREGTGRHSREGVVYPPGYPGIVGRIPTIPTMVPG